MDIFIYNLYLQPLMLKKIIKGALIGIVKELKIGDIELSAKDLIKIIMEYDIKHVEIPDMANLSGCADHDKRRIYVDDALSIEQKCKTVIHECLHVKYGKMKERDVERYAILLYEKLFG